jgi:hypothetical protein
MARVKVEAGACGLTVIVEAHRIDSQTVRVRIHSQCKQLTAMNPDLEEVHWRRDVFCRMTDSVVYKSAAKHISHTACPVPSAILKAIEAEVGLALAKDVSIQFEEP